MICYLQTNDPAICVKISRDEIKILDLSADNNDAWIPSTSDYSLTNTVKRAVMAEADGMLAGWYSPSDVGRVRIARRAAMAIRHDR